MTLWKLGCRWGSGKPLFYDYIKRKGIVIGWSGRKYSVGDWLLIADGFTVLALAKVKGNSNCVENHPELKQDFSDLGIDYHKDIDIYKADFLVLKEEEIFKYETQVGICRVASLHANRKVQTILNNHKITIMNSPNKDLLKYKKQIILQGPPGTGKTRKAKDIAELMIFNEVSLDKDSQAKRLRESSQFKFIQFHPSYTYEDFVRGIVTKPNLDGSGVMYEAENKTLGMFAKEALDNFIASRENPEISEGAETKYNIDQFIAHIIDSIDLSAEGKYDLSDNVYIFSVEENRFKYKGDNWLTHPNGLNMNFDQIEKIINSGLRERSEITKLKTLNSLTRSHATYYTKIVEKYYEFIDQNPAPNIHTERIDYVLIIDEINRANLSSVLGELIYALEYRGEVVESMYEVGTRDLILPPNLYIIGTMNTADRSVGHIDYAIRRRFAFIDVLPEDLSKLQVKGFDSSLFKQVSSLFLSNYDGYFTSGESPKSAKTLSAEFRPEDVWIGHSYFIRKKEGGDISARLEYEIKPLLIEYLKDGILIEKTKGELTAVINELDKFISQ